MSYCYGICAVLTIFYFHLTSEPLGGVRNLQVTDPTTSTLNVQWEPAEGNVRQYRIFYVPAAGGEEEMVCWKMVGKMALEHRVPPLHNRNQAGAQPDVCLVTLLSRCRYQAAPSTQFWRTCSLTPSTLYLWCPSTPSERDNACLRTAKHVSTACKSSLV